MYNIYVCVVVENEFQVKMTSDWLIHIFLFNDNKSGTKEIHIKLV